MLSKKKILDHINELIDRKIDDLQTSIASYKESRAQDTKSSAGDKYETGRAMIQMEIDKSESMLNSTQQMKHELSTLNINRQKNIVEPGSLVNTSKGIFFIASGIGKIEIDSKEIYAISLSSPIGQAMQGAKAGDRINFQEGKIDILNIE